MYKTPIGLTRQQIIVSKRELFQVQIILEREDLRDLYASRHINMNPTNLLSSNFVIIIQFVVGFVRNTALHV